MKIFRTNQYNSLNVFNYVIICSFFAIIVHFFVKFSTLIIAPYVIIFCTILLISYFAVDRTREITTKNNVVQKSITFFALFLYFLTIIFILGLILFNFSSGKIYTKPKDYSKAIKSIKHPEKISHFPKTIPANANKIQMYCYTSDYNGEVFIIKIKINKEFIEQELKKHKFLNSDTPIGTTQDIYYIFTDKNRIKVNNTTWFVINNEENKKIYPKYFPYYSSIGVSNNLDFIIYYYIEPND